MTEETRLPYDPVVEPPKIADRAMLLKILEEQYPALYDTPLVTLDEFHAMFIAQGFRPEDNAFSCEIKRMRDGKGCWF